MNGKGDKRRPMKIPYEEYEKKWNKIFGDKENNKKCPYSHIPNEETLRSMEMTEKGEGLTEYNTIGEMFETLDIPKRKLFKYNLEELSERSFGFVKFGEIERKYYKK